MTTAEKTCPGCEKSFTSDNPRQVHCSRPCVWVARRRETNVECTTCGTAFHARPTRVARSKSLYCSQACYHTPAKERACERCGGAFTADKSRTRARFCSRACKNVPNPDYRAINSEGYVLVTARPEDSGRYILEHRLVVSVAIGRPLRPEENVHHINGCRDDNRLENLELWSSSQPAGQRVSDKVDWAVQLLELYAPEKLVKE